MNWWQEVNYLESTVEEAGADGRSRGEGESTVEEVGVDGRREGESKAYRFC